MNDPKQTENSAESSPDLAAAEEQAIGQVLKAARERVQPRAEFVQRLDAQLRQTVQRRPARAMLRLSWARMGRGGRFVSLTAAVLLLLMLVGLVLVKLATPVSAQEVLQRATTVRLTPNQTAHYAYRLEPLSGSVQPGLADVWVQADASGAIVRTALTITDLGPDGAPNRIQHQIMDGPNAQNYDYNPRANTVAVLSGTLAEVRGDSPNPFDGASMATFVSRIAQQGSQGARVLPPLTLDGVPVVAVQVVPAPGNGVGESFTLYFDAQSYLLRGMDSATARIRITLNESVPAGAVPPAAFSWTPPADARRVPPVLPPPSATADQLQLLQAVCQLPPRVLDAARKVGDQSPLALCQANNPSMTQAALVEALAAPMKSQWDADVAAGKLTAAEETQRLANVRVKLNMWITATLGR